MATHDHSGLAPAGPKADPSVEVPRFPAEFPPVPRLKQVGALLHSLDRRHRPRPFLLYGQGRTGSNLLGGLLASHPEVCFGNEVLAAEVRRPLRYVEGLRAHAGSVAYGIHVKRYHLTDVQGVRSPGAWLQEAQSSGWLIIHIQRHHTLRHVLSNFALNATGVPHFVEGDGRQTKRLAVDPDEVLRWMDIRSRVSELELADLAELEHMTVIYERDLLPGNQAWKITASKIFDALGLAPHPVETGLRKVNEGALSDLLLNDEAVVAAVRGSRFAHLLDGS